MTSFSGWKLNSAKSFEGEKPGQESEIGFRGSRYTVDRGGKIYHPDYNNEKTASTPDEEEYVIQLRKVLSHLTEYWSGIFRIRGNGDTYCKYDAITYYLGNTIFDDRENFSGYRMNQTIAPNSDPKKYIRLWGGSHNSGQIGERWTIPDKSFAHRKNRIGNVGNRIARGEWVWSTTSHTDFINDVRSMFKLENFIRFYITSRGLLVRPITSKFWDAYNIDVNGDLELLMEKYPKSARSIQVRLSNSKARKEDPHLYFCFGHINELMNGEIPHTSHDKRDEDIDQDSKRWG